jgi:sec-independent protein translocase protein TatB
MFDIGFSEVLVIFVLALVVLGPEKLPKVAAQVGRWIGRARGMARQFREQLEEEVNLEEARKAQPAARTPPPPPVPMVPLAPAEETSAQAIPDSPATEAFAPPVPLSPVAEAPAAAAPMPAPEPEQQIVYLDTYSHAHPTDSLGRPVAAPTNESPTEPPATAPGQQDWVGGVTAADKPAQPTADAAYAPNNERGT